MNSGWRPVPRSKPDIQVFKQTEIKVGVVVTIILLLFLWPLRYKVVEGGLVAIAGTLCIQCITSYF